jgi:hypothetical protein
MVLGVLTEGEPPEDTTDLAGSTVVEKFWVRSVGSPRCIIGEQNEEAILARAPFLKRSRRRLRARVRGRVHGRAG